MRQSPGAGGCCPEYSVLVSLPFRKGIGPVLPCAFLFPDLPKALRGGLQNTQVPEQGP